MIALFIALGRTVSWRAVGIDRRTSMDSTNYKGKFVENCSSNNAENLFRTKKYKKIIQTARVEGGA